MRKIVLPLIFLCCFSQDVAAQPRNRNREQQAQQSQASPSPTPVDNRQTEIDNTAKAERERYENERDAKEDTFKAEQLRQNRIIVNATIFMAVFAGINLLVAIVYAFFAWRTLKAVDKQATHASQQVGKMGEQLEEMRLQRTTMRRQAIAAVSEARSTRDTLTETKNLVRQNEGVLKAMREQVEIMGVAIEPKLRISNVRVEHFSTGAWPIFLVSIVNEGATDARNVSLHIRVRSPEGVMIAQKWTKSNVVTIPAHQEQTYHLEWGDALTQEAYDNASKRLKVVVTIEIGEDDAREFCYRYYRFKSGQPAGVGQFVPCDLDLGITYVQTRESIRIKRQDVPLTDTKDEEPDTDSEENSN